jgi:hypothetical protein
MPDPDCDRTPTKNQELAITERCGCGNNSMEYFPPRFYSRVVF